MKTLVEPVAANLDGVFRQDDNVSVDQAQGCAELDLGTNLTIVDWRPGADWQILNQPAIVDIEEVNSHTIVNLYSLEQSQVGPTALLSRWEDVKSVAGNPIWLWRSENGQTVIALTDGYHLLSVNGEKLVGREIVDWLVSEGFREPVAV